MTNHTHHTHHTNHTSPIHVKQVGSIKRLRALIDTNVLISYLLVPDSHGTIPSIINAAFNSEYTLLLPGPLLTELRSTIKTRKHLVKRVSPEQAEAVVQALQTVAELLEEISEEVPAVTRDPKDDYLLAYALVGRADYLVTGDDDLLVLKEVEGVQIIRPAAFKQILTDLQT